MGGRINAESLDDAVGIITLIATDNSIKITKISIAGIKGEVSVCKKK